MPLYMGCNCVDIVIYRGKGGGAMESDHGTTRGREREGRKERERERDEGKVKMDFQCIACLHDSDRLLI